MNRQIVVRRLGLMISTLSLFATASLPGYGVSGATSLSLPVPQDHRLPQIKLLAVASRLPSTSSLTNPTDSCTYFVEGQVVDIAIQEPLPYASVQVKGGTQGG